MKTIAGDLTQEGWPDRVARFLALEITTGVLAEVPPGRVAPASLKAQFDTGIRDRKLLRIRRLERLLELARAAGEIQRKLFPAAHESDGLQAHWLTRPHSEITGDCFTVIHPGPDARQKGAPEAWLVLGDAQGKGPGAGA